MADDKKKEAGESKSSAANRAGFDASGKAHPGVDPETGERRAVTSDGLRKEFGSKRGPEIYEQIARAGGFGRVEGNPPLSLVGLTGEHKTNVEKILADAEKE